MDSCKIPLGESKWILALGRKFLTLLHSIWELLSDTLFACSFDFMYFFQFLPKETGRNTLFLVFSIPEETYFFWKFPNPAPNLLGIF